VFFFHFIQSIPNMHQVLNGFPTRFVFDFLLSNLLVLKVVVDQETAVAEVGGMAVVLVENCDIAANFSVAEFEN